MHKAFELIGILADGREHSGEDIAARLGISRAAVWNRIKRLQAYGMDIHAVPGRGYRLPGGFEFLDAMRVRDALPRETRAALPPIDVSLVIDSTNQRLLDTGVREDIHRRVCLAEYQTAGRGRRGDQWYAPPGSGLCLSLGWRFDAPPSSISALSLVVGVSLAQALERQGARDIRIKWPNDLLFERRKLAGILIEMRSEFGGPSVVVIGVGVNILLPAGAADHIDQPCTDIATARGAAPSRNATAAALVAALTTTLGHFEKAGFAPLESAWAGLDVLRDRPVRLDLPDRSVSGTARGVEPSGALIIEHGGRRETFISGHVSLQDGR